MKNSPRLSGTRGIQPANFSFSSTSNHTFKFSVCKDGVGGGRISFAFLVVNTLLHKLLSNLYLSSTIQFYLAINTKPGHNLVSYQCLHRHKHVIDQCQTHGRDQLSMSLHGYKQVIYQCQTNWHDQLSMSLHGHKHVIDQHQTNGRDQQSMSLNGHKQVINQCQTNWHNQLSMSLHGHKQVIYQ